MEYVYLVKAEHPDIHGCVPLKVFSTMEVASEYARRMRDREEVHDGTVYEVERFDVRRWI